MLEEYQRLYAEVSLDAIRFNMDQMKSNISENTQIMSVVKTDGYGHGAIPIAKELEPFDYMFGFAVATAEEAFILRKVGIKKPLLILGYAFPYSYKQLIEEDVRMAVFREDTLKELSDTVKELAVEGKRKTAKVHIKVDTGMNRIGIKPDEEGLTFVKKAIQTEGIEIEGIFTHFSKADEADKTFTRNQISVFKEFIQRIENETGFSIPLKHCSNSAGVIEIPEANMNVVRTGITQYGLWPSDEVSREIIPLKPALSLYSQIVYCKEISEGSAVSYSGIYVAKESRRIATIPVGYGDGYPRSLSNKAEVLIAGKRAPILGRICMDQFMVDVTDIPEAKEGSKVTLIGKDGEEEITMEQLGDLSGRFNYELACDLGKRIPRVYIKDGKILCTRDYYQDF